MAFVKKLQTGGSVNQPLQDFLVKKLSETSFTTKGEKYARQAAENFLKLYNSGNFKDV